MARKRKENPYQLKLFADTSHPAIGLPAGKRRITRESSVEVP